MLRVLFLFVYQFFFLWKVHISNLFISTHVPLMIHLSYTVNSSPIIVINCDAMWCYAGMHLCTKPAFYSIQFLSNTVFLILPSTLFFSSENIKTAKRFPIFSIFSIDSFEEWKFTTQFLYFPCRIFMNTNSSF